MPTTDRHLTTYAADLAARTGAAFRTTTTTETTMPTIDIPALITALRSTGRTELIHYAGAAHRDPVAHAMCLAYLADPSADEPTLKARALEQLRAASSDDTLSAVLVRLGYTHHPRANPHRCGREVRRDGSKVWEGTATDCWAWLRETGQLPAATGGAS